MIHRVTLVRHGESEQNIYQPAIIGGRSRWCELTERGTAQAKHLGRWLAQTSPTIDRVVSSTAVRAQQTARYSIEQTDIPLRRIETFTVLEELDQGDWENRIRAEVYTVDALKVLQADSWHFAPPGGESQAMVFERGRRWMEEEVLSGPAGHTWVFTHGLFIKLLLTGLLDWDRPSAWTIPIHNTSLTTLSHSRDGWRLERQDALPQGTIDDAVYL
jgi:broad specificity phosphatase PhoE